MSFFYYICYHLLLRQKGSALADCSHCQATQLLGHILGTQDKPLSLCIPGYIWKCPKTIHMCPSQTSVQKSFKSNNSPLLSNWRAGDTKHKKTNGTRKRMNEIWFVTEPKWSQKEPPVSLSPELLALKHKSRILGHSSMMEQVIIFAVWPMENWLGTSLNQILGWTTVRESYSCAFKQEPLFVPRYKFIAASNRQPSRIEYGF